MMSISTEAALAMHALNFTYLFTRSSHNRAYLACGYTEAGINQLHASTPEHSRYFWGSTTGLGNHLLERSWRVPYTKPVLCIHFTSFTLNLCRKHFFELYKGALAADRMLLDE